MVTPTGLVVLTDRRLAAQGPAAVGAAAVGAAAQGPAAVGAAAVGAAAVGAAAQGPAAVGAATQGPAAVGAAAVGSAGRALIEVVRAAIEGGAGWVVLRERDLPYAERRALADEVRALLPPGRLIVAGTDPLGGTAQHLAASEPLPRGPLAGRVLGRSCHSAAEIEALSIEDYVTLSPVFDTETKPGYGPALTPAGAAALDPPVPWLALGGVDSPERVRECIAAGAAGVAVLGAIMRAADPARTAAGLVAAMRSATGDTRPAAVTG